MVSFEIWIRLWWNSQMMKKIFAKSDEWQIIPHWRMTCFYHHEIMKIIMQEIMRLSMHTPLHSMMWEHYLKPCVWLWHNPHFTGDLANKNMFRESIQRKMKSLKTTQCKNWLKEQIVFWLGKSVRWDILTASTIWRSVQRRKDYYLRSRTKTNGYTWLWEM